MTKNPFVIAAFTKKTNFKYFIFVNVRQVRDLWGGYVVIGCSFSAVLYRSLLEEL